MPSELWDRDAVAALAAGSTVVVRDELSKEHPVPDWLLSHGATRETSRHQDRVLDIYPDDLRPVMEAALASYDRPGELVEVLVRVRDLDGDGRGWLWERIRYLNLLSCPDMAGVVCMRELLGPVVGQDAPAPPEIESDQFEDAAWAMAVLNERGVICATEGMVTAMLGMSPAACIGRNAMDFIHVDDHSSALSAWITFLEDREHPQTARQRLVREDQSIIWTKSTLMRLPGQRETDDVVLMWNDLTHELGQRAELVQAADEFRLLAEEVPGAVFRADRDGHFTFRNSSWDALPLPPTTSLLDVVGPADQELLESEMHRLLADEHGGCVLELPGPDTEAMLSITLRCVGEQHSGHRAFVGSVTDITDVASLRHRAERDPLTGLLNRRAIEQCLAVATREGDNAAVVVFIDLDGFKSVNDEHGHDAGDAVLVEIARRLGQAVRPDDAVGRFGGDEFVLICPHARAGAEQAITRRVEVAFADPIVFDTGTWQPAASIGTTRSHPPEPIEAVIRRADRAMFAIKREHQGHLAAEVTAER